MSSTHDNSKSSFDDSITERGFIVNEALSYIQLTLRNLGGDIQRIHNIGAILQKVGGSLPYNLKAAFGGFNPLDPEMSDEGFALKLDEIVKLNKDPIQRALAFGSLAKKLMLEIERAEHRFKVLTDRIKLQKNGPEAETAKRMRLSINDSVKVFAARLEFVLDRFFAARNKAVEALVSVNRAVYDLFPNGSPVLRSSYLRNHSSFVDDFKRIDDRLALGYHTSNRKTVKI